MDPKDIALQERPNLMKKEIQMPLNPKNNEVPPNNNDGIEIQATNAGLLFPIIAEVEGIMVELQIVDGKIALVETEMQGDMGKAAAEATYEGGKQRAEAQQVSAWGQIGGAIAGGVATVSSLAMNFSPWLQSRGIQNELQLENGTLEKLQNNSSIDVQKLSDVSIQEQAQNEIPERDPEVQKLLDGNYARPDEKLEDSLARNENTIKHMSASEKTQLEQNLKKSIEQKQMQDAKLRNDLHSNWTMFQMQQQTAQGASTGITSVNAAGTQTKAAQSEGLSKLDDTTLSMAGSAANRFLQALEQHFGQIAALLQALTAGSKWN